jgi:hypothetical protein
MYPNTGSVLGLSVISPFHSSSQFGQPAVRLTNRISAPVILIKSFFKRGVQQGHRLVLQVYIIYLKSLIKT